MQPIDTFFDGEKLWVLFTYTKGEGIALQRGFVWKEVDNVPIEVQEALRMRYFPNENSEIWEMMNSDGFIRYKTEHDLWTNCLSR